MRKLHKILPVNKYLNFQNLNQIYHLIKIKALFNYAEMKENFYCQLIYQIYYIVITNYKY